MELIKDLYTVKTENDIIELYKINKIDISFLLSILNNFKEFTINTKTKQIIALIDYQNELHILTEYKNIYYKYLKHVNRKKKFQKILKVV